MEVSVHRYEAARNPFNQSVRNAGADPRIKPARNPTTQTSSKSLHAMRAMEPRSVSTRRERHIAADCAVLPLASCGPCPAGTTRRSVHSCCRALDNDFHQGGSARVLRLRPDRTEDCHKPGLGSNVRMRTARARFLPPALGASCVRGPRSARLCHHPHRCRDACSRVSG